MVCIKEAQYFSASVGLIGDSSYVLDLKFCAADPDHPYPRIVSF
jgi:hypothetical protein